MAKKIAKKAAVKDEEVQEITPDLEHLTDFFRYMADVANVSAPIDIEGSINLT